VDMTDGLSTIDVRIGGGKDGKLGPTRPNESDLATLGSSKLGIPEHPLGGKATLRRWGSVSRTEVVVCQPKVAYDSPLIIPSS